MSEATSSEATILRSLLGDNRFGDETLRVLESLLVSRDVRSLLETRSALQEVLRSEAASVLREIAGKSTYLKLQVAEFFVRAFALVGDVESCLALKYEALVLREVKCINDPSLTVSYDEWIAFAEDSFGHEFYSIAVKGFDSALACMQFMNGYPELEISFNRAIMLKKIKQRKDLALALIASRSVRTQAAEHMETKKLKQQQKLNSCPIEKSHPASSMYREGIRKRNMQGLLRSQAMKQDSSRVRSISPSTKL